MASNVHIYGCPMQQAAQQASNPDFWTAVVGLFGAWIIAAAVGFVVPRSGRPLERRVVLVGMAAMGWPAGFAVWGLVALAQRHEAPPTRLIAMIAFASAVEASMLMFTRLAAWEAEQQEDHSDGPTTS